MRVGRPARRTPLAVPLAVAGIAWGSSSCAPTGFASESLIASVRVLAASADKPYARPGDVVNMQVIAFDGRKAEDLARLTRAGVTWLPFVCKNPLNDAYYNCFAQRSLGGVPGGGDGVVDAGGDDGGRRGTGVQHARGRRGARDADCRGLPFHRAGRRGDLASGGAGSRCALRPRHPLQRRLRRPRSDRAARPQ